MMTIQIQELARVGAEARLRAIGEERQALLQAFPDLGNGTSPSTRTSSTAPSASPTPASRKRSGLSPAQRKAVGERIKAYWEKRRGEKAAGADAVTDAASETPSAPVKRKSGMSADARKAQGERMRAYWAAKRAQKQANSTKRAGRKTGRKK